MKKTVVIICFAAAILAFGAFRTVTLLTNEGGTITISDGKVCASADVGFVFSRWSSGNPNDSLPLTQLLNPFAVPIYEKEALSFPIIDVRTENNRNINSKEEYVNCSISVENADAEYSFSEASARIRLRGNSTAGLDKHPYKIKFDNKISLLGEDSSREWTLIANHMDYSLLRNCIAYSVADELDSLRYTTSVRFAEVYVNGSFEGLYTVCVQIEVDKNRVNIDDSLESTDTGYLIEMDSRAEAEGTLGRDFFTASAGYPYTIKSPDTDDENFTEELVAFIQTYVNNALLALDSGNWDEVGELIDIPSFADGYILDELLHPVDIGFSSFFMYKDKGGKLCRGPVWDYDLSMGNTVSDSANSSASLYSAEANPWYKKLLAYPEFRNAVSKRLSEKYEDIENRISACFSFAKEHDESFKRNFKRWEILGKQVSEWHSNDVCGIKSHDEQTEYLKSWIESNISYTLEYYGAR